MAVGQFWFSCNWVLGGLVNLSPKRVENLSPVKVSVLFCLLNLLKNCTGWRWWATFRLMQSHLNGSGLMEPSQSALDI